MGHFSSMAEVCCDIASYKLKDCADRQDLKQRENLKGSWITFINKAEKKEVS
jgi:phage gp36-like protein